MKLFRFLSVCKLGWSSDLLRNAPLALRRAEETFVPQADGDEIKLPTIESGSCSVADMPYATNCGVDNKYLTVDDACGDSIENPCPFTVQGDLELVANWTDLHCGKCYKIGIDTAEHNYVNNTDCANEFQCSTYQAEIYAVVTEVTALNDFRLHQNGWMRLCPFVCLDGATGLPVPALSEFCVQEEAYCANGVREEYVEPAPYSAPVVVPGSCRSSASRVFRMVEVECSKAVAAPAALVLAIGVLIMNL